MLERDRPGQLLARSQSTVGFDEAAQAAQRAALQEEGEEPRPNRDSSPFGPAHPAAPFDSPVRILTTSVKSETKILPSPGRPVRADSEMV